MKIERLILTNSKIFILTIGVMVVFISLALAYDLKEYYPLVQGNSWVYSVTEEGECFEKRVRIEGKERIGEIEAVRMLSGENGYKCIAVDSEEIKLYKDFDGDENVYTIYNPPKLIFANIGIGEIKEYSTVWTGYSVGGEKKEEGEKIGQIKLESVENIEVPAGKFIDCLRFSLISEEKKLSRDSRNCTVWLARGVGLVKEFHIFTEYDAETKEEETSIELRELISAVVNGKKIGRQEAPTR